MCPRKHLHNAHYHLVLVLSPSDTAHRLKQVLRGMPPKTGSTQLFTAEHFLKCRISGRKGMTTLSESVADFYLFLTQLSTGS